jgi:hypothetical protein
MNDFEITDIEFNETDGIINIHVLGKPILSAITMEITIYPQNKE